MSKREKFTQEQIIEAIKGAKGLLALAAQKLGCRYETVHRYAKRYPAVMQCQLEQKETILDLAEYKLFEKVVAGDMTAIIFLLKTQGKPRGYIEKQEQYIDVTTKGESIKPDTIKLPDAAVTEAVNILARAGVVTVSSN